MRPKISVISPEPMLYVQGRPRIRRGSENLAGEKDGIPSSDQSRNKKEVQNKSFRNSKNPDGFLPFPGF
jgi:hypothetical protein